MKFTPGARLEMGYREKLPRESEAILKTPVKELQRGLYWPTLCQSGIFRGAHEF